MLPKHWWRRTKAFFFFEVESYVSHFLSFHFFNKIPKGNDFKRGKNLFNFYFRHHIHSCLISWLSGLCETDHQGGVASTRRVRKQKEQGREGRLPIFHWRACLQWCTLSLAVQCFWKAIPSPSSIIGYWTSLEHMAIAGILRRVLQLECEMSCIGSCVSTLGFQMVVLVLENMEPSGAEA